MGYPNELPEVVAFLGQNAARMRHFISDSFSLGDFGRAIDRARSPHSAKVMVCLDR